MKKVITLCSLLMLFVASCDKELSKKDVEKLIQTKDFRERYKSSGVYSLSKAVYGNNYNEIKEKYSNFPDSLINFQETYRGWTLLHNAVHYDKYKAVKALLELGANPNIQAFHSTKTAMISASVKRNDLKYAKLLLKYGANVNKVSIYKDLEHENHINTETPLLAACRRSGVSMVKLLIENGANFNYEKISSRGSVSSPLYSALSFKDVKTVNYLIIEKKVHYDSVKNKILYLLRCMVFPLNSEMHKEKMILVSFLRENGLDYWQEPIPTRMLGNYDKDYLSKY